MASDAEETEVGRHGELSTDFTDLHGLESDSNLIDSFPTSAMARAVGGLAFAVVVLVGGLADGLSVREMAGFMKSVVEARVSRKTVVERIREIEAKRPGLIAVAHEMRH